MDHIKAEIIKKYGDICLEELTGGYTNKVYLLRGTDPEIVIKIISNKNKDYTEIKCLELLNHTSVTPKIHEILEVDHTSVIIMEYIDGINSQRILDRIDWVSARNIYAQLGRHLVRDIHNIKYDNQTDDIPLVGLDILERLDELGFIPETLVEQSKEWLSQLEFDNYVLVHGDYGPHNTIYSDEKLW
jgi:aminoglycoside phosphotransferase (APT) family kinase protein